VLLDSETEHSVDIKQVPTDENKLRFIIARREANRLKREAINRYSENTVNKLSDDKLDVKKFWSL